MVIINHHRFYNLKNQFCKKKGYFVRSKEKIEEEKTRLSGLCPNGVLAPPWSTQQSLRFPNLSPFLHYLAPSERN